MTGIAGKRVLVTRPIPEAGMHLLREAGVEVILQPEDRPIRRSDFLEKLREVDAAIIMLTERMDDEAVAAASDGGVRCIANFAVGIDNLRLPLLTAAGIYATNTPGVLTDATADLAWALLLAAARRVVEGDAWARKGTWEGWGPMQLVGKQVTGATLGVVGAGRIGRAMARRAMGFDMTVLYTPNTKGEPCPELEAFFPAGRCRMATVDEIAEQADFISLHVPLTSDTRHLISAELIDRMKPGMILVNTARGPVVDEEALIDSLENGGPIVAAGLDVFECEPFIPEKLRALPNVVILPHIGSATRAVRSRMSEMTAESVLAALRGTVPPRCLNGDAHIYQRHRG